MDTPKNKLENLDDQWKLRYRLSKIAVYSIFSAIVLVFSYRTLFPSQQFAFFFKTPQASKNTIIDPRKNNGDIYHSGKILADGGLVFDTPLEELESDYSRLKVKLILDKSSTSVPDSVRVKKSYRSFLYPAGDSLSAGKLAEKIENSSHFLGSPLFSYGDAVYIIDGNTVRPFNSVETFLSLGYSWDDVRPAEGDEFMKYEKGKLFTASIPHPQDTIFSTRESGDYYFVDNGKLRKIEDPAFVEKNLKHAPILADGKSWEISDGCSLSKNWSLFNQVLTCELSIEKFEGLTGNDYQFTVGSDGDFKIKEAQIVLDKSFSWSNLKKSLIDIRKRITQNYVQ